MYLIRGAGKRETGPRARGLGTITAVLVFDGEFPDHKSKRGAYDQRACYSCPVLRTSESIRPQNNNSASRADV